MDKSKLIILITLLASSLVLLGMSSEPQEKEIIRTKEELTGKNFKLEISEGKHWQHKLKVIPWLPIIQVKNPPQIAVWIEDDKGNYLTTLYVTNRTAKQNWRKAPGDNTPKKDIRRKSSLPHWAHQRGIKYDDGLYLPTKDQPLPDVITSATPKKGFQLATKVGPELKKFIVKVEINHSADFNQYYPQDAKKDEENYSGGEWGSGQPAVVYAAEVDLSKEQNNYQLKLIGHSSPDGNDGSLNQDLSKLTTAKDIVQNLRLVVN